MEGIEVGSGEVTLGTAQQSKGIVSLGQAEECKGAGKRRRATRGKGKVTRGKVLADTAGQRHSIARSRYARRSKGMARSGLSW